MLKLKPTIEEKLPQKENNKEKREQKKEKWNKLGN